MTRSSGRRERLLMRLSVMPSEMYSVFGSPLVLLNGKTTTESIPWLRQNSRESATAAPSNPAKASEAQIAACHWRRGLTREGSGSVRLMETTSVRTAATFDVGKAAPVGSPLPISVGAMADEIGSSSD